MLKVISLNDKRNKKITEDTRKMVIILLNHLTLYDDDDDGFYEVWSKYAYKKELVELFAEAGIDINLYLEMHELLREFIAKHRTPPQE